MLKDQVEDHLPVQPLSVTDVQQPATVATDGREALDLLSKQ